MLKIFQNISHVIEYLFSNTCNETRLIKDYFKNREIIFVDVGANLGFYFNYINKNVKLKKSFLIEPSKNNYEYLKKNLSTKKIVISNIAFSNITKNRMFYEYNISSVSSFYKMKNTNFYKINSKYKVKTISLDMYCKKNKIQKIDFLKIDAEYEDFNILKGSRSLLKAKKIDLIKIELNFYKNRTQEPNGEKIIQFLNNYNYKILSLSKTKFIDNKIAHIDIFFN